MSVFGIILRLRDMPSKSCETSSYSLFSSSVHSTRCYTNRDVVITNHRLNGLDCDSKPLLPLIRIQMRTPPFASEASRELRRSQHPKRDTKQSRKIPCSVKVDDALPRLSPLCFHPMQTSCEPVPQLALCLLTTRIN